MKFTYGMNKILYSIFLLYTLNLYHYVELIHIHCHCIQNSVSGAVFPVQCIGCCEPAAVNPLH